jgi:hypothetical protein
LQAHQIVVAISKPSIDCEYLAFFPPGESMTPLEEKLHGTDMVDWINFRSDSWRFALAAVRINLSSPN